MKIENVIKWIRIAFAFLFGAGLMTYAGYGWHMEWVNDWQALIMGTIGAAFAFAPHKIIDALGKAVPKIFEATIGRFFGGGGKATMITLLMLTSLAANAQFYNMEEGRFVDNKPDSTIIPGVGQIRWDAVTGKFRFGNGSSWMSFKNAADPVVSSIGTINGGTESANGASISGSTLYMQTADATYPGLVSTGAQTFAGDKTFTGLLRLNATALAKRKLVLYEESDDDHNFYGFGVVSGVGLTYQIATTSNNHVWYAESGGTSNELMRLKGGGSVLFRGGGTNTSLRGRSDNTYFYLDALTDDESTYKRLRLNGSELRFQIEGSDKVFLDAAGKFGIGTTPGATLDVKNLADGTVLRLQSGSLSIPTTFNFTTSTSTLEMNIGSSDGAFKISNSEGTLATFADGGNLSVPNLTITTVPVNDDTETQILVRDATTGDIEYRTAASLAPTEGSCNPTFTCVSNCDGTGSSNAHYIRVDDKIFVTGTLTIDATAASTLTVVKAPFCISSNFTSVNDAHGVVTSIGAGYGIAIPDTANDVIEIHIMPTTTTSQIYKYQITYLVK